MRIIIAGSREFNDYEYLKQRCNQVISFLELKDITIISGTANGADKLGEQYAKEKGYEIKQYPANWNKYGKSAGYLRNVEMAENADVLIAFWRNQSKGTKHMIDIASDKNLKVHIF